MKAITLWPEWAHAVAHLGKRVENRGWHPPIAMMGQRIAVHAGAHVGGRKGHPATREGMDSVCETAPGGGVEWTGIDEVLGFSHEAIWRPVVCSAIVCTAVLSAVDVGADCRRPWAAPGSYWWLLEDVAIVPEPLVCKGARGFWDVPLGTYLGDGGAWWRAQG